VPVEGNHPAYILYTSGTTGAAQGRGAPTAGHLVALNWTMKNIYDVEPGEVFWAASDVGWVVGHSYICYAPLIHGNTTIVFEGKPVGTPDAGTFWRVIAEHKVPCFFTAPTALPRDQARGSQGRAVGKHYDLSGLRALYLAGERADPTRSNGRRSSGRAGDRPLVADRNRLDHRGQPAGDRGAAGQDRLAHGADAGLRRADPRRGGHPVAPARWAHRGEAAAAARHAADAVECRGPVPQSYLTTFPGYYETGDAGMIDEDGYLYIMARTDDVINVAGHRLSTGAMEEVLAATPMWPNAR
jgi:propionyl-CoA synthetase